MSIAMLMLSRQRILDAKVNYAQIRTWVGAFAILVAMDNFRWWAFWRRAIYGGGFLLFWSVVGTVTYYVFYNVEPTCFDGVLNGSEIEVDAGGTCVRLASSQVMSPQVAWAQSFETVPGQYNAVAYIDNRNVNAGAKKLDYTFTFKDNAGQVITTRSGSTELPPNSSLPVFEGRVFTEGREVATTELVIDGVDTWLPATSDSSQFVTLDRDIKDVDTRPRLNVKMQNNSIAAANNIEVVATIFNDAGQPVAASETFVENFPSRMIQDLVFTWPNSIAKTVRSCTIPTDVVLGIDLSGSMNNDQANPPQPVTDALAAAGSFVENLGTDDQVGVVTFASDATLAQPLTKQQDSAIATIAGLRITPEAETGFTNTADAFARAAVELSSGRGSADSRRAFVLLTDGLPTAADGEADPEIAARAAAQDLSDSGADVYVIGLGSDVNQNFLQSLASDQSRAYLAPSRSNLSQIYTEITASLCESGPTKVEVIAKTPTNFAPLR